MRRLLPAELRSDGNLAALSMVHGVYRESSAGEGLMKRILQVLRKTEMLLLTASLKADRYLGMGGRYRPPAPIAVRVASRPLRSAAVLAVPLAALAGTTFGAFTDGTRFLQAVLFGTGLMLFFALCLRVERLAQLHYERVGYDPAARQPVHAPGQGGLGEALAQLCKGWVVLTVLFWCVERAKGSPISWLFSGVSMGLVLCVIAVGYVVERKRQRAYTPNTGHLQDLRQSRAEYDGSMRRRARVPFWMVLLCLAGAVFATSYATRTVRPHCPLDLSIPMGDPRGTMLVSRSEWKLYTAEERTDAAYDFAVGTGRCMAPEPRWRQWLD
ncbi:hypothetical protein [Streptomyces sp. NPDC094149]|uniref:hypothetical protein n=1 Tax=Streptomyces sp. NPDC094149 TaxID=3155079 RepID=UPI003330A452